MNYYNNNDIPVYIVSQPPLQKYPAELAYFQLYKGLNTLQNISINKNEFLAIEKLYKSFFLERSSDINFINLTDEFCDVEICPIGTLKESFYADTNHLYIIGSKKLHEVFSKILLTKN